LWALAFRQSELHSRDEALKTVKHRLRNVPAYRCNRRKCTAATATRKRRKLTRQPISVAMLDQAIEDKI
jgi:hypothetical protein